MKYNFSKICQHTNTSVNVVEVDRLLLSLYRAIMPDNRSRTPTSSMLRPGQTTRGTLSASRSAPSSPAPMRPPRSKTPKFSPSSGRAAHKPLYSEQHYFNAKTIFKAVSFIINTVGKIEYCRLNTLLPQ